MRTDALFCEGDLHATLQGHLRRVDSIVERIPKEQFLNASDDAIVENAVAELSVLPLELDFSAQTVSPQEALVKPSSFYSDPLERHSAGIPGTRVLVEIPFTGDPALFKLRPNSFSSMFPRASVVGTSSGGGHLEFSFEQAPGMPPEQVKQNFDQQVRLLTSYVTAQRSQVEAHNSAVAGEARRSVLARRARLREQNQLVTVLGIPLKQKDDVPSPLPMRRKLVRPLPSIPQGGVVAEPGIADADYEHILNVVRHEGCTFETTPRTFTSLDEEPLRDILLAHLNGHYEGDATGETFRRSGKTDIRIEDQNRCAFVAECKLWTGDKKFLEAVDQLLGYLTWRDCKASLVVFNKSVAGFAEVLERVPGLLQGHRLCRGTVSPKAAGEWRCRFVSDVDAAREILLHVFLFNLHTGRTSA
jgi:hypothetical protein